MLFGRRDAAEFQRRLDVARRSGVSWYAFFIDTGDPATTRDTWLMIAQATGGNDGTWRTDDGGDTWERVESNEHGHGQAQIFQTGGVVYMAGVYGAQGWGVYRSTDFARTWSYVGSSSGQNGVYGTGKFVYTQSGGANAGGIDQSQSARAPLPAGTDWSTWPVPTGNGPKRAAVTYDASALHRRRRQLALGTLALRRAVRVAPPSEQLPRAQPRCEIALAGPLV